MPDRGVRSRFWGELRRQGIARQQLPAKLEPGGPESIGQKAEVADAHEALGQDVEEEPAQELRRGQGHLPLLAAVGVILPAEGDTHPVKRQKPMVGDGHAMRVAAQIAENLSGAAEGRLGIHHPVLAVEAAQQLAELLLIGEGAQGPAQRNFLWR